MSTLPLADRHQAARARAVALLDRAAAGIAVSTDLQDDLEAQRLVLARRRLEAHSLRRRLTRTQARGRVVRVSGSIDGRFVTATWSDGELIGDQELVQRAETLVAMGERWPRSATGDRSGVTACLAGPPALVALTLMRACTVVTSVELPASS
jgi:hypothetical protein